MTFYTLIPNTDVLRSKIDVLYELANEVEAL